MSNQFSPIQNHILSTLKNATILRYAELQPERVPNDLFNYHLQFLVKKEYVTRSGEGYALSDSGIKHIADPFSISDAITSLYKINVITIVSRINDGNIEILNQVRASNPSMGKVGVMGGVVLKGELIPDAAMRKLKEETGLVATFRNVACERRIMYRDGELFSDVLFPICYSDDVSAELQVNTRFGTNRWVSIDQAIKNESGEYDTIKSISKVLIAIRDRSISNLPFSFEENIQSHINDKKTA